MNHFEDIQKKHFPVHTKRGTKRFFAQIETFYEKLQSFSAVNLKNARVIPYGPPGGITLTCPTVIHHKEQKMAWFIYVFGKKNASVSNPTCFIDSFSDANRLLEQLDSKMYQMGIQSSNTSRQGQET